VMGYELCDNMEAASNPQSIEDGPGEIGSIPKAN
jgi:hypothetical protein